MKLSFYDSSRYESFEHRSSHIVKRHFLHEDHSRCTSKLSYIYIYIYICNMNSNVILKLYWSHFVHIHKSWKWRRRSLKRHEIFNLYHLTQRGLRSGIARSNMKCQRIPDLPEDIWSLQRISDLLRRYLISSWSNGETEQQFSVKITLKKFRSIQYADTGGGEFVQGFRVYILCKERFMMIENYSRL